jgi:hypothetical protein
MTEYEILGEEIHSAYFSPENAEFYQSPDLYANRSAVQAQTANVYITEAVVPGNPSSSQRPGPAQKKPEETRTLTDSSAADAFLVKYWWNERFQLLLERPTTTPEEERRRKHDVSP